MISHILVIAEFSSRLNRVYSPHKVSLVYGTGFFCSINFLLEVTELAEILCLHRIVISVHLIDGDVKKTTNLLIGSLQLLRIRLFSSLRLHRCSNSRQSDNRKCNFVHNPFVFK